MTSPQEPPLPDTVPTLDTTVRLDSTAKPDSTLNLDRPAKLDRTVKLDPTAKLDRTVKLDRTLNLGGRSEPAGPDQRENDSATLLAGEAWGTPDATVELPATPTGATAGTDATAVAPSEDEGADEAAPDGLRRFGPGVPGGPEAVPVLAAALWHGTLHPGELSATDAPRPGRRRRRRGWLLPVAVLLAVLGYLLWQWYAPPLAVTAVSVHTDPAGPGCDGTAVVTATLRTDGHAGTVTYRWRRSDGTVSGDLSQPVARGNHQTDVVLRWTFDGKGTLPATATLDVISPTPQTASASFTYTCH